MSSFIENAAAVASAEIQAPPAQDPVNFAYGGAGEDGASVVHAPPPEVQAPPPNPSEVLPVTVYQPESVVVPAPAPAMTAAEVVNQFAAQEAQRNGNGDGSNGSAAKRRRGRPRKYAPASEGAIVTASPLSAVAVQSQSQSAGGSSVAGGSSGGADAVPGSGKRGRGRPLGSRGKHKASSVFPFNVAPVVSGLAGVGFTPHYITVQSGMDVLPRIMSFSQVSSQAACVLSASGTLANVTLQQSSGGIVSYEGRFEILSIAGSYLLTESGGHRSRTGGLTAFLAGSDGVILGGSVAGPLMAASPVQVIVGTFMAANQQTRPGYNDSAPPKHVSSVGGSPPSRATASESSGGPVSPFNNSGCNNNHTPNMPNIAWS